MDDSGMLSADRGTQFKSLYRKLERPVAHIERMDSTSKMLEAILEHLCNEFADDLGFEGGRIYSREGEDYELCCGFGASRDVPRGLRVPRDYPPHRRLLRDGVVLMARGDPGVDDGFEDSIGVGSTFAAIGVGQENRHVIAFSLKSGVPEDAVFLSLGLVRHVINLKLQQQRLTGILDGARHPGPAAGAYILVDREGKVFEERGWFLGTRTNNEAEYEALIAGMSGAAGHGCRVLSVFSDSELVVRQMQGTYRVRARRLLPYHTRARETLARFRQVSFRSVTREDPLIQRADLLCNQVLDAVQGKCLE